MTVLAPRLEAAFHDTLSFDFAVGSLALLDRSFSWREEKPVEELLRGFVRDTLHIRRSLASPRPATDAALLAELVPATPGTTTATALPAEPSGRIVVLDGVRVRLPAGDEALDARDGHRIRVPSWRPRLTPGYAHVTSDDSSASNSGATRVYLSATGATQLRVRWHATLSALARTGIPYRAKVCSNAAALPRADAIVVLSLDSRLVRTIVDAVGALPRNGEETLPTSLFALEVAPGVALGVEPATPLDGSPVSFGESRSAPVAAWLHRAIVDGRSPDIRELAEHFTNCGIDPQQTWAPLGLPSRCYPVEATEKENRE